MKNFFLSITHLWCQVLQLSKSCSGFFQSSMQSVRPSQMVHPGWSLCSARISFSKPLNHFELDSTEISSRTFTDFSKTERVGLYTVFLSLYSSTKNISNKQLFSCALKLKISWESPFWLDCVVRLKGMTKHNKTVYTCKSWLLTTLFKTVFYVSSAWEAEIVLLYLLFFVEGWLFVLVRGKTSCRSARAR